MIYKGLRVPHAIAQTVVHPLINLKRMGLKTKYWIIKEKGGLRELVLQPLLTAAKINHN